MTALRKGRQRVKFTSTKPAYQVVQNQDSDYIFHATKEPIRPDHIDNMVDAIADGGADVMLINPNDQRTNFPSKVWQTFWDGYTPGDRSFFGDLPDDVVAVREHRIQQMVRLRDQGCNYLARALGRCRERGIVPGVTVRMNDMHDAGTPSSHVFSRFYRDHPECRTYHHPAVGGRHRGLNYACDIVRDHYVALIEELVADYDFDVMELDFARFPYYFPPESFADAHEIMTGFVGRIRRLLGDSGRRITLTIRVASTPAAAMELGFDLAALAAEGLVDGVTCTAFLNTAWQMPVDAFRNLMGDDVGLYAGLDYFASQRREAPFRRFPFTDDLLRGFAAGYLASGVDGVYTFNLMAGGNRIAPNPFDIFRQLKSLTGLRGQPKTYLATAGTSSTDADPPVQAPVSLKPHQVRGFDFLLAAEPEEVPVSATVVFDGEAQADRLRMRVGNTPVGPAERVEPVPENEGGGRRAVFSVPSAALADGLNTVDMRYLGYAKDTAAITILGLEMRVG